MVVGRFLGMVGALIWDPSRDRYLILKRSAEKDFAKNIWECGTGRVDQGETFTSALLREMKEELDKDLVFLPWNRGDRAFMSKNKLTSKK